MFLFWVWFVLWIIILNVFMGCRVILWTFYENMYNNKTLTCPLRCSLKANSATQSSPFGRKQGLLWLWLWCAPWTIIRIIDARNHIYCRQHVCTLLNMDLRAVHLMTTNRPFSRSQELSWLWLWCAPGIITMIIVAPNHNYCRQHFRNLLNMGLRQRGPSYDYKFSFWPLAGIIMIMTMTMSLF